MFPGNDETSQTYAFARVRCSTHSVYLALGGLAFGCAFSVLFLMCIGNFAQFVWGCFVDFIVCVRLCWASLSVLVYSVLPGIRTASQAPLQVRVNIFFLLLLLLATVVSTKARNRMSPRSERCYL